MPDPRHLQSHRVPGGALPSTVSIDWLNDYQVLLLPEDGEADPTCGECVGMMALVIRLAVDLGVTLAEGEVPMFGAHPSETDTWVFWTIATRTLEDGAAKRSPAEVPALTGISNRFEAAREISLKLTEGAA